ncbi:hypothetical protein DFR29_1581 [Tahibacter aquaticus]|uniref:Transposase n=1 Tax=Tahibacter aquaticus TaxID=520092 RepID=A0A4R6YDV1_9GAMM|nr:hypothetical protein DFR29_1581 [Tahibacter aquaticus]
MQASKTEAFWRRHVEAWRSSGLTQKQYSAKHGINALTLAHWSYLLKRRSSKPAQALVPVRVIGEAPPMTVELQHGAWRIAVPVGTDPRWLAALIRETSAC